MRRFGLLILALAATPVCAQVPPQMSWPEIQARRLQPATPSVKALREWIARDPGRAARPDLSELLQQADAAAQAGDEAKAQRYIAELRTRMDGRDWTAERAFAGAMRLTVDQRIVDPTKPLKLKLKLAYDAPPPAGTMLSVWERRGDVLDQLDRRAMPRLKSTGFTTIAIKVPRVTQARRTTLVVGSESQLTADIVLVPDLAGREADAKRRLSRIDGHEEAKASILYPYQLARLTNEGKRELERASFADRLALSDRLLTALEAGNDPVRRGTGDQVRHWQFEAGGEIMPYRLYVPTNWDGKAKLPLVLALHGGGADENEMFELAGGRMQRLAEQFGYIVVSPLGYRPGGAYGNPVLLPAVYGYPGREGRSPGDVARQRLLALSEAEVMGLLEHTAVEYGADRRNLFVTGHSMGGGGTWHLASKYRPIWRGMAASAGPFFPDGYDFERLRGMGVMLAQGDNDPASLNAQRKLAADLLNRGIGVTYAETPGADHGNSYGLSLLAIFDFFERQRSDR